MMRQFLNRARRTLNLADFSSASHPIRICESAAIPNSARQYILRMMLRSNKLPLTIPAELEWLRDIILQLDAQQIMYGLCNPFVYVTVRHGIVNSSTDDAWHVDGFSMRAPHLPEQNYIFTSNDPTEFLIKRWRIPGNFDPLRHNIHQYFADHQEDGRLITAEARNIYLIDPYCVHRRPDVTIGIMRTFWRVSFLPIEIEDDTCTRNPCFPWKYYDRADMRHILVPCR